MFKNIIDIIFNKKENNVYDRPSFNEVFFAVARIWRLRSTCLRTKVGACLVKDNQILATGYNGNPIGMPHCSNDPDSKYYCPKMKVDAEHGTADE